MTSTCSKEYKVRFRVAHEENIASIGSTPQIRLFAGTFMLFEAFRAMLNMVSEINQVLKIGDIARNLPIFGASY